MSLVRAFQLAAVILAVVSIYLFFADPRSDYLFASIILMICARFLAYRFHLMERVKGRSPTSRKGASLEDASGDKD
jgi:hypothetical protein